ncbi:hypothetical protein MAR_025493 [Mya arenaria]|uniref:Uncharacterized protein n=1 Tax=Mya arenaria TaxID=6604 RepID=A0ABY7EMV4_MYAAR|nr:hypothetical protein MAR_025493 [Mya arenaria]
MNKLKLAQSMIYNLSACTKWAISTLTAGTPGSWWPSSSALRTVRPCDVNAKVCMTLIISCMNNSPSPEIFAHRHAHMPALKAAKRQSKRAWLSYDRLYIDGKPVYTDHHRDGPEGAGTGSRAVRHHNLTFRPPMSRTPAPEAEARTRRLRNTSTDHKYGRDCARYCQNDVPNDPSRCGYDTEQDTGKEIIEEQPHISNIPGKEARDEIAELVAESNEEVDENDQGEQVELRHAVNDNTSRKIEKRVPPKPLPRSYTRERRQPERYERYEDYVMNAAQDVARLIDN